MASSSVDRFAKKISLDSLSPNELICYNSIAATLNSSTKPRFSGVHVIGSAATGTRLVVSRTIDLAAVLAPHECPLSVFRKHQWDGVRREALRAVAASLDRSYIRIRYKEAPGGGDAVEPYNSPMRTPSAKKKRSSTSAAALTCPSPTSSDKDVWSLSANLVEASMSAVAVGGVVVPVVNVAVVPPSSGGILSHTESVTFTVRVLPPLDNLRAEGDGECCDHNESASASTAAGKAATLELLTSKSSPLVEADAYYAAEVLRDCLAVVISRAFAAVLSRSATLRNVTVLLSSLFRTSSALGVGGFEAAALVVSAAQSGYIPVSDGDTEGVYRVLLLALANGLQPLVRSPAALRQLALRCKLLAPTFFSLVNVDSAGGPPGSGAAAGRLSRPSSLSATDGLHSSPQFASFDPLTLDGAPSSTLDGSSSTVCFQPLKRAASVFNGPSRGDSCLHDSSLVAVGPDPILQESVIHGCDVLAAFWGVAVPVAASSLPDGTPRAKGRWKHWAAVPIGCAPCGSVLRDVSRIAVVGLGSMSAGLGSSWTSTAFVQNSRTDHDSAVVQSSSVALSTRWSLLVDCPLAVLPEGHAEALSGFVSHHEKKVISRGSRESRNSSVSTTVDLSSPAVARRRATAQTHLHASLAAVLTFVASALEKRISDCAVVVLREWEVPETDGAAPILRICLALTESADNPVTVGPPTAASAVVLDAFKELYPGHPTTLRRFLDGSMAHTVVWGAVKTLKVFTSMFEALFRIDRLTLSLAAAGLTVKTAAISDKTIVPCVEVLPSCPFPALQSVLAWCSCVIPAPSLVDATTAMLGTLAGSSSHARDAYQSLSTLLNGVGSRKIDQFPLRVNSVQPVSTTLRSTAVVPLYPQVAVSLLQEGEGVRLALRKGTELWNTCVCKPSACIPLILELESSPHWPLVPHAIRELKTSLYVQLCKALNRRKRQSLRAIPTRDSAIVLFNGFIFMIYIRVEREFESFRRLGGAMTAALSHLNLHLVTLPAHHALIQTYSSHYAAFGITARITKLWFSRMLLRPVFTEEAIELLCAAAFAAYEAIPPMTALSGLLVVMRFLATFPFGTSPLVVPEPPQSVVSTRVVGVAGEAKSRSKRKNDGLLGEHTKRVKAERELHINAARIAYLHSKDRRWFDDGHLDKTVTPPALFISAAYAHSVSPFTKDLSGPIVRRAVGLASAALLGTPSLRNISTDTSSSFFRCDSSVFPIQLDIAPTLRERTPCVLPRPRPSQEVQLSWRTSTIAALKSAGPMSDADVVQSSDFNPLASAVEALQKLVGSNAVVAYNVVDPSTLHVAPIENAESFTVSDCSALRQWIATAARGIVSEEVDVSSVRRSKSSSARSRSRPPH